MKMWIPDTRPSALRVAVFCAAAMGIFFGGPEYDSNSIGGSRLIAGNPAWSQRLGGGGQGQGSGGVSGGVASPQGQGSGGTAAGSGITSSSGNSTGPGGVNQNRFGGSFPPPPTEPGVDLQTITDLLNTTPDQDGFQFPDRCLVESPTRLGAQALLAGENLKRLNAAQVYLAPNFDAKSQKAGLHLLANYQEELVGRDPNTDTASSYLALVAARPLTSEIVARVNAILCVTATRKQVQAIASLAEAQRASQTR